MRIAFFGGSFDPPHRGHVAIATAAADRLSLDQVLVAPVGRQPLKDGASLAGYEDRLAMVALAFATDSRFESSRLDAPRPDGQYNYTYETLEELRQQNPAAQLFFLLGADSFHTLAHWHRATELILLCDFIIAARPGYDLREIASRLPAGVRITAETATPALTEFQLASIAQPQRTSQLHVLTGLEEDVSATALRQALASGDPLESSRLLPTGVAEYICEHHLYGAESQCE